MLISRNLEVSQLLRIDPVMPVGRNDCRSRYVLVACSDSAAWAPVHYVLLRFTPASIALTSLLRAFAAACSPRRIQRELKAAKMWMGSSHSNTWGITPG